MRLLRDVICRIGGKGQGCPIIYAKVIDFRGIIHEASGSKTPAQNITSNNAPWDVQYPYLREIFSEANTGYWGTVKDANGNIIRDPNSGRPINNTGNPRQFFPGQTYSDFSPQTENALNMTEQRALAGSPVQRGANEELQRTLGGNYLHGGSGFDAAYEAARSKILPDIQSRYALGGRFGSGLARAAEAKGLGEAFASQYNDERERQLKAMMFAPQAAESDYNDLRRLAGVGEAREGQSQSAIDEAMARHNFAQEEPTDRLARYLGLVQGNYGSSGLETTTGFKGNKGAGILGGALGGAGIGAQLGGGWGAGIGGILGGLGGLL